jgi:predicted transposase/invertase (TIGR01784 family)
VEVKEQAFRLDGVFLPESEEDHIYFLEVQYERKPDFYSRFLTQIFLYLRHHQPPNDWRAVVMFPGDVVDPGVHRHFREFFDSGRLQRIYLDELPPEHREKFPLTLLQIISAPEQEMPQIVEKIIKRLPSEIHDENQQEKIIELFISLLVNKLTSLTREEIEKMTEPLVSDIKKTRFYQEVAQEKAREIAKTLLKKQMNLEFVIEVTGLSREEVLAISKELELAGCTN